MLNASGITAIGIDLNNKRVDLALKCGLNLGINPSGVNIVDEVLRQTNGYGADAVIITAASSSDTIINQAIEMCRKKGKVVIVGDVALNIKREAVSYTHLTLPTIYSV